MAATSPQPETSTARAPSAVAGAAASPPPNCAICLGSCINKCFSDSCMHQFCFKCLLEWSKVKAVCPLCKQPFNSIIHNVKSNNEYDEHFIARENEEDFEIDFRRDLVIESIPDFYLPTSSSRLFQFRTTLTVDPSEFAIQQLLSIHPLSNLSGNNHEYLSNGFYDGVFNRHSSRRRHRDVSSSNYRRSIYSQNLWVNAPPDLTGRYREISPQFFRENPASRNRLVPWLNRELNVLLLENTPHVMYVVDTILIQLNHHHIRSRYFRNLLEEFLGEKTDHFIHEFYNYMKSPYDMIGYDRNVYYTAQPPSFSLHLSDEDDSGDSDIALVSVNAPRTSSTIIEINSESSHDSDVILQEPAPPVVVDLVNSDESNEPPVEETQNHKPLLPLKIRLKHKRQCRERRSKRSSKYRSRSSDSESTDSSSSEDHTHKKYRPKRKYKQSKYYIIKEDDDDEDDSDEPILSLMEKSKKLRKRNKRCKHKSKQPVKNDACTNTVKVFEVMKAEQPDSENSSRYTPQPAMVEEIKGEPCPDLELKVEVDAVNDNPGPSGIKFESSNEPNNSWFKRPLIYSSDDDESSDN